MWRITESQLSFWQRRERLGSYLTRERTQDDEIARTLGTVPNRSGNAVTDVIASCQHHKSCSQLVPNGTGAVWQNSAGFILIASRS